jgi:5'-nucleotidase
MKILLTNDDGYHAPGLHVLWELTEGLGERTILAPDASSTHNAHKVTVERSLYLYNHLHGQYSLNGTPVDCVRIGTCYLLQDVDWVIVGINAGATLGAETYTSATIAAAREATILGFKAIAISHFIAKGKVVNWDLALQRALPVIRTLLHSPLEPGSFWNVNLPHVDADKPVDIAFRPLDPTSLDVQYIRHDNSFTFVGQYYEQPLQPGFDVESCHQGKITLTRIPLIAKLLAADRDSGSHHLSSLGSTGTRSGK